MQAIPIINFAEVPDADLQHLHVIDCLLDVMYDKAMKRDCYNASQMFKLYTRAHRLLESYMVGHTTSERKHADQWYSLHNMLTYIMNGCLHSAPDVTARAKRQHALLVKRFMRKWVKIADDRAYHFAVRFGIQGRIYPHVWQHNAKGFKAYARAEQEIMQ